MLQALIRRIAVSITVLWLACCAVTAVTAESFLSCITIWARFWKTREPARFSDRLDGDVPRLPDIPNTSCGCHRTGAPGNNNGIIDMARHTRVLCRGNHRGKRCCRVRSGGKSGGLLKQFFIFSYNDEEADVISGLPPDGYVVVSLTVRWMRRRHGL